MMPMKRRREEADIDHHYANDPLDEKNDQQDATDARTVQDEETNDSIPIPTQWPSHARRLKKQQGTA
ncbi:hypothetical protein ACP70R_015033 [Stipagrostis hirtigluma subsp. patula]